MISNGIKYLIVGMALLIGGFGTAILSIYSLLIYNSYVGIVGVAAFIIGLGFTALASTKIKLNTDNSSTGH